MARFWKRRGDELDLERELRARRPEPRTSLVESIIGRIDEGTNQRRSPRLRLALMATMTAILLVGVASAGGIGYAATAAKSVAKAVTIQRSVSAHTEKRPDDDQYHHHPHECMDAVHQERSSFQAAQVAARDTFQGGQQEARNAFAQQRPKPSAAERKAFASQQRSDRRAFNQQQKADRKAFNAREKAAEKECEHDG